MPSKRVRRARHEAQQITALQLAYLMDGPLPLESEWSDADRWWWTTQRVADWDTGLAWYERSAAALWRDLQDQLLPAFVKHNPGRRPRCWWDYTAPRQPVGTWPGWWCDGKLCEPRIRLGGVGTPKHEILAYAPVYEYGIPTYWVEPWEVAFYKGLEQVAVNGELTGAEHRKGGFKGVAIDPRDPPVYESQAAYLERYGLFLPGERRRLRKAEFQPEPVA